MNYTCTHKYKKRKNNSTIRFAVVYVRMLHLLEVSYICVCVYGHWHNVVSFRRRVIELHTHKTTTIDNINDFKGNRIGTTINSKRQQQHRENNS